MAGKSKDRKTIDLYRSSVTGRIVPKKFAEQHPRITEHERIKKK